MKIWIPWYSAKRARESQEVMDRLKNEPDNFSPVFLNSLASRFGVTVEQLLKANGGKVK